MNENLNNYLALARTAAVAGNYQEAMDYFNKVLEIDPTNVIAWIGKGEAAGWMSSIQNLRFPEMIIAFETAINFSNNVDETKKTCSFKINEIATACYTMCRNHMLEFISLNDTWVNYLSQCMSIIDAYETAYSYNPSSEAVLKNIIHVCEDNIKGVSYTDEFDNNTSKAVFLSPEYEQTLRDKMALYGNKLQLLDKDYVIPNPEAAKPSSCFVVTATMGNENNDVVIHLRRFRDNFLSKNKYGQLFIKWYYSNGPKMAKFISKSIVLRALSFILIVMPAYLLTKFITIIAAK